MSFKEVVGLDTDTTTALGGTNRTTGKPNPTKIEGYYLGSKDVASPKARSGFAKLHILQTEKGNVGVWGKTDLDRKMQSAPVGTMLRITQNGKQQTPNGDMYKFKVEFDADNTIEVSLNNNQSAEVDEETAYSSGDTVEADSLDADQELFDEPVPPRAVRPTKTASAPDAARQAKVQALLNSGKNKF